MLLKDISPDLIIKIDSLTPYASIVSYKIYPRGVYDTYFLVNISSLGNCQTFTVGWFNFFLSFCENSKDFIENLKYIQNLTSKNQLLIDINEYNLNVLKLFIKNSEYKLKDMILFTKKYKSTNDSIMYIVQLNLKNTILK